MPSSANERVAPPGSPERDALLELQEAGGEKQWLFCRFGFNVANAIVDAGWATIDNMPVAHARVRLTNTGRSVIGADG